MAPVADPGSGAAPAAPATWTRVALWATGLAALALFGGLGWWLAPLEPGIVELQMAFTARAFAGIVHAWPAQDLVRYRAHLPWDMALAACYGSFGFLLVRHTALFSGWPRWARRLAQAAPPLAAAFDAGENALHAWLTAAPRLGVAPLYALAASCSAAKWLLLAAFTLACAAAALRTVLGRARPQGGP
jgi:hypothetical protein